MVDPITIVAIGAGIVAILGSIGLTMTMIFSPPNSSTNDPYLKRYSYSHHPQSSFFNPPML